PQQRGAIDAPVVGATEEPEQALVDPDDFMPLADLLEPGDGPIDSGLGPLFDESSQPVEIEDQPTPPPRTIPPPRNVAPRPLPARGPAVPAPARPSMPMPRPDGRGAANLVERPSASSFPAPGNPANTGQLMAVPPASPDAPTAVELELPPVSSLRVPAALED